jgi:CheY-like chemotaxis protein
VYSEVGKGTTLKLYLPTSSERVVKQEDQKEALLKGSETILLVDDEDVIRELGENILGSLGYTVLLASDGDQALKTFEEYRNDIDLVILDLVMPGMDGKETCTRLKDLSPEVKVLISSGYSKEMQQQGLPGDGVRFIQKPFKIADLSQAIREAIDT